MTTDDRRRDLLVLALLLLLPVFIFADVVFLGAGFYDRDLTTYHWPMRHVVREALLSGEFPQWNPLHLNGQPLAANPAYEIFYPPQLLILLPDFKTGFQLLLLFHIVLALGGMFLFLRSLDISRAGAAFGAASFGFGGPFLSTVNLNPAFFSIAWFPLVLLYFRKFIRHRRRSDAVRTVLALSMILVISEPVSVLQIGFLMLGYLVHRAVEDRSIATRAREVAVLAVICTTGALICAVQLIPAVDHAGDSVRATGLVREESLAWSTPPLRLIEIVYANVFGPLTEGGGLYWASNLYGLPQGPFIRSFYAGALFIVLAVGALWCRARGTTTYAVAAFFAILLALGSHTRLGDVLYDAGLLKTIRYPEKWMLLVLIPLVAFSSFGFDAIVAGSPRARRRMAIVAGCAFLIALMTWLLTRTSAYPLFFKRLWKITSPVRFGEMVVLSSHSWFMASLFALFALLLILFRARLGASTWIGLVVIVSALDLGSTVDAILPRMPASFFEPPPIAVAAKTIRQDPRLLHAASFLPSRDASLYNRLGAPRYWSVRNGMSGISPLAYHIETPVALDVDATALKESNLFLGITLSAASGGMPYWRERVADVARTNLRTEWRAYEPELERIDGDFAQIQPVTLVVDAPRPPLYFASEVIPVRDWNEFVKLFLSGGVTDDVVAAAEAAPGGANARVVSSRRGWNWREIEVDVRSPSFLVVASTPHRYWSATVDGAEAKIVPANVISTGIRLQPGDRSVRLTYDNPTFRIGAIISILALIALPFIAHVLSRLLPPAHPADDPHDIPQHS